MTEQLMTKLTSSFSLFNNSHLITLILSHLFFFFFNDTATTEIYTLSLHDALPIYVFAGKGADRWLLPAYDRDTIRPNAMGKFSTLLQATAQSPAMLFYLDNFQSVSPNAMQRPRAPQQQRRRGINENYARELMELHTIGVDGGYTQKDVQEVARCFTGWTIFQPRGGAAAVNAMMGEAGRRNAGTFFFNMRAHDDGEKVVLGQKIPAGGGIKDGLMVLDILTHHPSTAKFIATKLVRHFVADNPPASLVNRVAATYT